jgi:hypothetical protein
MANDSITDNKGRVQTENYPVFNIKATITFVCNKLDGTTETVDRIVRLIY